MLLKNIIDTSIQTNILNTLSLHFHLHHPLDLMMMVVMDGCIRYLPVTSISTQITTIISNSVMPTLAHYQLLDYTADYHISVL